MRIFSLVFKPSSFEHFLLTYMYHRGQPWTTRLILLQVSRKKKKKIKQLSVAIREISVRLNGRQKEDILHQIYIYPFKTDTRKTDK